MSKRALARARNKSRAALSALPHPVSRGAFAPVSKRPDGSGELLIMDDIGGGGDKGVTSARVREQLSALKGGPLTCTINSDGGVITEGKSIYDAIRAFPGEKTGRVEGIAASMASVILQAFDYRVVTKGSYVMIHNPSGGVEGEAEDMRRTADLLSKMRDDLLDIYEARTGQPRDKLGAMMDAETWMTAEEAVALGFADEVEDSESAPKAALRAVASLKSAKNIPEALRALANPKGKSKMTDDEEKALRDKLKALEEENAKLKAADDDEGDKPAHDADDEDEGADDDDVPEDSDDDDKDEEKKEARAVLALVRQLTGKKGFASMRGALVAKLALSSSDVTASHKVTVDEAIKAGKLAPAMRDWAMSDVKGFAAYRKALGNKTVVPVGSIGRPTEEPKPGQAQPAAAGDTELTAPEKAYMKASGKSKADILKARNAPLMTSKKDA